MLIRLSCSVFSITSLIYLLALFLFLILFFRVFSFLFALQFLLFFFLFSCLSEVCFAFCFLPFALLCVSFSLSLLSFFVTIPNRVVLVCFLRCFPLFVCRLFC